MDPEDEHDRSIYNFMFSIFTGESLPKGRAWYIERRRKRKLKRFEDYNAKYPEIAEQVAKDYISSRLG
jgi:hypothetical protein